MRYDQLHYQYHNYHRNHNPQPQPDMLREFTYFPKLPPEIRTMVWEYALPDGRVYEVLDAPGSRLKTPAQQGLMFANVHPEPPPALAAVGREPRYLVLRRYRALTLGRTTKYVDLSRDLLLLEPYLLVKRLHRTLHFMSQIPLVRDGVRRLALGTSYGVHTGICHPVLSWKVHKSNVGKMLACLARFPRFESLVFIVHQEFRFEFDFTCPLTPTATTPTTPPEYHQPPSAYAPPYGHPLVPGSAFPSPLHTNPVPAGAPNSAAIPSPPPSVSSSSSSPSPPAAPHQRPLQPPVTTLLPTLSPPAPSLSPPTPSPLLPTAPPLPSLPSAAPPALRPQLVHQAYRFKFDIEANINRRPRRPHRNELLYYPLDVDEDGDDWDLGGGSDDGNDDAEGVGDAEWFDPWPTNDDWRRFRRRFQRALHRSLAADLQRGNSGGSTNTGGGSGGAKNPLCKGGRDGAGWTVGPGGWNSAGGGAGGAVMPSYGASSRPGEGARRRKPPALPALQGASLLWRYTEGGYV